MQAHATAGEKPIKSELQDYSRYQVDQQEQYQDWYPAEEQEHHQERHQERMKQEPIDLTEDDEEMDAALGCVAALEAGYGVGEQAQTTSVGLGAPPHRFRTSGEFDGTDSWRYVS